MCLTDCLMSFWMGPTTLNFLPEPAQLAMLASGLAGMLLLRRFTGRS